VRWYAESGSPASDVIEDCGVLSPLSPRSLVPAVATVEIDRAFIWCGNADTDSSNMYGVPSLDMWLEEHAELWPGTRPQSAPVSVPDDITDTGVDNCSLELLEPTTTSA